MADGTSRVSASSISRLLAKKGFLRSKHGETEGFSVMHPQTGPSYEPDPTRVYIFYRASGPDESRQMLKRIYNALSDRYDCTMSNTGFMIVTKKLPPF